jgi:hypothetical protein
MRAALHLSPGPLAVWCLTGACALGCAREPDGQSGASAQPSASAAPPPVDRLAPGELAPGKSLIFGLVVPDQMKILTHSPKHARLEGEVEAGDLIEYVRDRVVVSHVEIGAGRTIFPKARIKDGPPDKLYQLEVVPNRRRTLLTVEDVTPPKAEENISQEERWRRAGRRPDGSVDPALLR